MVYKFNVQVFLLVWVVVSFRIWWQYIREEIGFLLFHGLDSEPALHQKLTEKLMLIDLT